MSIQQDINSALGQVGIIASLNPTLQQKAKNRAEDRAELEKIKKGEKVVNKQFAAAREKYFDAMGVQTEAEKSEVEAQKGKPKVLLSPEVYAEGLRQEVGNVQNINAKREQLAQRKFDIAPSDESYKNLTDVQTASKYWGDKQSDIGKPVTEEGQMAWEAIQRAEQKRENLKLNIARRKKYLYQEMERMMPGFKYMDSKQQRNILGKMSQKERDKIKDEAERREKYYGK